MIVAMHIHSPTCEIKKEGLFSGFSSCKEKPAGLCVYCGRAFCAKHGEHLSDGSEVCTRKSCVA